MTTGKSYIYFTSFFLSCPGYLKRCQMSHGCWWQEATGEESLGEEEQEKTCSQIQSKLHSSGSKRHLLSSVKQVFLSPQMLAQFAQDAFSHGEEGNYTDSTVSTTLGAGPPESRAAITAAGCWWSPGCSSSPGQSPHPHSASGPLPCLGHRAAHSTWHHQYCPQKTTANRTENSWWESCQESCQVSTRPHRRLPALVTPRKSSQLETNFIKKGSKPSLHSLHAPFSKQALLSEQTSICREFLHCQGPCAAV